MTRRARWVIAALVLLAVILGIPAEIVYERRIPGVPPPQRGSFAPAAIAAGAHLVAIGNCAVCHTAPDGRPFAGGRAIETPFGTIFANNITPDPETGIGVWSPEAFARAMRRGIGRDGRHLYPAFPYSHFTRATDDDLAAMYAFLMTRTPVHEAAPPTRLPFPLNLRGILAGWNLMFLHLGVWQPDTTQSAVWNRGAYLVEAIGHCGACHTPHNAFGAEKAGQWLRGGEVEGWYAPALEASSPAREPWTADELFTYLRTGLDSHHGAAAGPMGPVTHQLATAPEADVRAIAVYIASLMPKSAPRPVPSPRPASNPAAAAIFAGACGSCHAADAPMTRGGAPSLAVGTAVNAPTPRDAIQIILQGIPAREGAAGPYMPAFAATLSDQQVAELVAYLREQYGNLPPWTDIDAELRSARRNGGA